MVWVLFQTETAARDARRKLNYCFMAFRSKNHRRKLSEPFSLLVTVIDIEFSGNRDKENGKGTKVECARR
jgi:hypothetical protein